jgi:hypothetical protein
VDFVAHKPRWRNDTSSATPTEGIAVSMPGYDWDTIYHLEDSFKKCWIKDFSDTPCVLYRGGWNETLKFYSIHHKPEVLFAPRISENISDTHRHIIWREPLMILPLTYTSLRVFPNPRIREVTLTLNLKNMMPKEMKCKGLKLPTFSYGLSAPKRKPLQFFMAGVITAVVATAVMTTLTAPLFIALDDLKQVTKHQDEAIEALSRGLKQLTPLATRNRVHQKCSASI